MGSWGIQWCSFVLFFVCFFGLPASSGLSEASIRLGSVEMGGRVRLTLFGFWDDAQFSSLKASPRHVPG
jgi:hypothetical protein